MTAPIHEAEGAPMDSQGWPSRGVLCWRQSSATAPTAAAECRPRGLIDPEGSPKEKASESGSSQETQN